MWNVEEAEREGREEDGNELICKNASRCSLKQGVGQRRKELGGAAGRDGREERRERATGKGK